MTILEEAQHRVDANKRNQLLEQATALLQQKENFQKELAQVEALLEKVNSGSLIENWAFGRSSQAR